MMLLFFGFVFLGVVRCGVGQVSTTPDPSQGVNCTGAYDGVTTRDELFGELVSRVVGRGDSEDTVQIKRVFLRYLTRTPLFLEMINCAGSEGYPSARFLQEDEDGDEEGGGGGEAGGGGAGVGGAAGAIGALTGTNANPLDNTNVLNGVRRILANVFTGNLIGIIQESVGLRSPEPVTTVFTDVLSTLFGSAATAGVTGIVGNVTTPSTLNVTSTLLPPGYEAYIQQHYLQQQYLAQQQALLQQGGGQVGGVGGIQHPSNQGYLPTQSQYLQQQYLLQQQGNRRPGGVYQQQGGLQGGIGGQGVPLQNVGGQGVPLQNVGGQGVPLQNVGGQGVPLQNVGGQGVPLQNVGGQGVPLQNVGGQGVPLQNVGGQGVPLQNVGGQGVPLQNVGGQGTRLQQNTASNVRLPVQQQVVGRPVRQQTAAPQEADYYEDIDDRER